MSAHHALYLALIILVLLAILVLVSAALVRRPRQEWEVAVRGQTQDVRNAGMPSLRNPGLRPRRVSLEEMWAANSVPESAYVGAPKIPHREEVVAALAPAPRELLQQYQGVFLGAQVTPAPSVTRPPVIEDDEFYEPEVVSGEISLFNAALDRPDFEGDQEWTDGAELTFADVVREKAEIAKSTWTGVSSWVSDVTGSARALFAKDGADSDGVEHNVESDPDADSGVLVDAEPVVEAEEHAEVSDGAEDDVEVDDEAEVEAQDDVELEPWDGDGIPTGLPPVPAPPPEPEDLDNWVRGLGEDRLGSEGHSHPRWRSTSNTEESTL